jgi:hypothetical protein
MYKTVVAFTVFASVLASSLLGFGGTATAHAAANYMSWPEDIIFVYDTTSKIKRTDGSPLWPVHAAAERWDNNNPVDFRYTTKRCPAGSQCVTVRQSELAPPAVGVTTTSRVGADIRSATIVLDTTFGRTNSSLGAAMSYVTSSATPSA